MKAIQSDPALNTVVDNSAIVNLVLLPAATNAIQQMLAAGANPNDIIAAIVQTVGIDVMNRK